MSQRDHSNLGPLLRQHYESADGNAEQVARVMEWLDDSPGPLTPAQLAPLDQFHVGGLATTQALAELAGLEAGMNVLDAGSGLGGPSRYLAQVHGCRVTGVDLMPSFVELSRRLAERTGLGERVEYVAGDLAALPFPDGTFDLVWTQHVVMNLPDRASAYREFRRMLRPGGNLVFFDVYAPDAGLEPHFPVPWAQSAQTSFLMTRAETEEALEGAGFGAGLWQDVTARAVQAATSAPPPALEGLSLTDLMGPRFAEMLSNLRRNLAEGRVRLAMGRYPKL